MNISINNLKGGVNKTGSTIEIGACLGSMGKKVLLLDMDQQCNLSDYTDCDFTKPNILNLLEAAPYAIDDYIQKKPLFDVICGTPELSTADKRYSGLDDIFLLNDAIEYGLKDRYDYILIDNPPARGVVVTMSFVAADQIVIPTECDDGSIKGVVSVMNDLKALRDSRNHYSHAKIAGIILNRYERTNPHNEALSILSTYADQFEDTPLVMTVRKGVIMSDAKSFKMSVQERDKNSGVGRDFMKISIALKNRFEEEC